jgi:hypothetical protein
MFDFVPEDLINIILNPREEIVSNIILFKIFFNNRICMKISQNHKLKLK